MALRKAQISPQYIRKGQITITVLDVLNPGHFIIKESPSLNTSSEAKIFLEAEESMQKYYESVESLFFQLPLKDSIIVVFHEKKFYRARVIRILTLSSGHLFKVYLVDYGVECSVPRDCIYEIGKDFLSHPFQAVDMKLLGLEPLSLVMNSSDLSMSYGPVTSWDPSAGKYINDVLKEMCNVYIEVKAIDEEYIHGSLFVCYKDNTVKCVNDELISQQFAHFNEKCWKNVRRIEDVLKKGSTENFAIKKSLTPEKLNPEQMSNSSYSPSKLEAEIKNLTPVFIRPSDGKVVARPFFRDDAIKSPPKTQEIIPKLQLVKPSDDKVVAISPLRGSITESSLKTQENTPKPQGEIPKVVSPVISEDMSPGQKGVPLTRLQKLQMLNRKRHSSLGCQSNIQDTVNNSPSATTENIVLEGNTLSDVTKDEIKNNAVKPNNINVERTHKESNSSTHSSNIYSNNLNNQSNAASGKTEEVSENKSKQENASQAGPVASKRLQKLQELNRKRRSTPSTDVINTSNVENKLFSSSDKTGNSPVSSCMSKDEEKQSNPNKSTDRANSESAGVHSPASRNVDCSTITESSSEQACVSEAQLIACKPSQKPQLLNKRGLPSPIHPSHCQNVIDKSPPTTSENTDDNANCLPAASLCKIENPPIKVKTSENKRDQSDNDDINSYNLNCKGTGADEMVCLASENSPKKEDKPVVISENLRTFQRLQQSVRMKKMMLQTSTTSLEPSNDMKKIEESSHSKSSIDTHADNSNAITNQKLSTMNPHQGRSNLCKIKALLQKKKGLTESSATTNEQKLLHDASGHSKQTPSVGFSSEAVSAEKKTVAFNSPPVQQQELVSSEEITCKDFKEMKATHSVNKSIIDSSPKRIYSSPPNNSKSHITLEDLEVSPMEPKQSEILNELLAASDSDDLLCSISKTKEESFCDNNDVDEKYIELSTQLKHSDPKLMTFDELSLWEKQKIPALLIGIGLLPPAFNVKEAEFSKHVSQVLEDIKFYGPSCIQSIIWPCMEKNRCMIAIAPPHSGKTVSYVLPLVSSFTEGEMQKPHNKGPSTIVLCSSWRKAQAVYDFFYFFLRDKKMNIITLCTDGGLYRNRMISLVNSCDVLIATPYCLLQFMKNNLIKFENLENFILDDSTALMNKHKKELKNILLNYMSAMKRNMMSSQLMLFAERWNKNFCIILDKMMSNPLIFFTSFLESALYAKISIFAHVCEPEKKKLVLLDVMKAVGKVIICTIDKLDAVEIHHYLRCEAVASFLVTEEMEHYIANEVIKDWKSVKSMATSHCLVITDQALVNMQISNADCLIHYDIPPESRLQFGNRFSCIAEHFQVTNPTCVSHILITESDCYYAPQILEIVENSGGKPSEELIALSKRQIKVESTTDLLCPYLKAFGFCKEHQCKHRHIVDSEKDKPKVVPSEGDIHGLVTQILDASHYYVRLLKYLDPVSNKTVSFISTYAEIGFKLRDFYSCAPDDMRVESPVIGESYVLAEENKLFYRIKVLKQLNVGSETALPSWKILFLDEGWIKYYEKFELYKLSDQIKLPEPLAVEVYVCNIITPDSCFDWNPQTSLLVSDIIKGKEIKGKIVLCLEQTLWLDPIAVVLHLSGTNEDVNMFKLDQKLLEYGHMKQNKNHLIALRQACAGKIPLPHIAKPKSKRKEKTVEQTPAVSYAFLECYKLEDVYVSSVISPHQLYIQRAKFVECLDNLLENINMQLEKKILKKAFNLHKGMHCIAPFHEDDRYYRAVITDIVSYTEVHLFYVDFGDSAKAPRNNIYHIPAEFLLLPFQAIECELAGIAAAHGGWTDSSANALTTLTRDEAGDMKIVLLKAYSKTSCYKGGNHYVIDLWSNEKNLSEQLLQAGFGVPAEGPTVEQTTEISHYSSSEHSSDEEFDLNERKLSPDDDFQPDDSEALFYNCVAEMVLQAHNLIPRPGVTITEVSSDDEKCMNKPNESLKSEAEKACNDFVKLLPKINQGNKNGTSSEPYPNRPLITWWDTPEQLNILINLKEVKLYQLVVTDDGFNFSTIIGGVQYSADEKFYDKIHSSDARNFQTFQGINIVTKKQTIFKWPRFTKEKKKFLHIKYDLFHIDDSDTEEQPTDDNKLKLHTEYEAMDEGDDSTTDEEEKYVEPWKDLTHQNSIRRACD